MAQEQSRRPRATQPEVRGIDMMRIQAGAKLTLINGATVEVIENPGDGYWLLAKCLASPDDPSQVGTVEMVFFEDLDELVEEWRRRRMARC